LWDGIIPPYFIKKRRLWEVRPDKTMNKWDWLVHLTEKTWIKELELYQLNTAFFFAQDYFKNLRPKGLEKLSTWKTLEKQKEEFETRGE
jgi:hypothetical protein